MRRISLFCGSLLVLALALPAPQAEGQRRDVKRAWELQAHASALKREGRLREAIPLLEEAIRILPGVGEFQLDLGETYVLLKDPGRARPHLEAAASSLANYIRVLPKESSSQRINLAKAQALLGEKEKAEAGLRETAEMIEAELKTLPGTDALDWDTLFKWTRLRGDLALIHDARGEAAPARAIRMGIVLVLEKAAADSQYRHKERAFIHRALAREYELLNDPARARASRMKVIQTLEKAAAAWQHHHDQHASIHRDLAQEYDLLNDPVRARASRMKVVEIYQAKIGSLPPADSDFWAGERESAHLSLGEAYEEAGDFAQARASYLKAMERRPDRKPSGMEVSARRALLDLEAEQARSRVASSGPAEGHFRRGFDLLKAGQLDEAAVEFQAGLAKKPGEPLAHFYVAEAYGRRDDVPEAIRHYHASLRSGLKQPHASQARGALGLLYARQASSRFVDNMFGPSSSDRLRYVEYLARTALFHARAGDAVEARSFFSRALEKAAPIEEANCSPFRCKSQALVEIAWRQAAAGDLGGAMESAKKIPSPTARAYALGRIARLLPRRGAAGEARGFIGQAFEQAGAERDTVERVQALRHIAEALWEMGDAEGARKALRVMRAAVEGNTGVGQTREERLRNVLDAWDSTTALDRRGYAAIQLALALLKTGDRSGALQAAGRVQENFTRAVLVEETAQAGYPEEAERFAQGLSFQSDFEQMKVFSATALSYARKGRFGEAWRAASGIRKAGDREGPYYEVARLQAEAGDPQGASKEMAVRLKCDDYCKSDLRRAHALGLARKGNHEAALKAEPDARGFDYGLALAYSIMGLKEE